MTSRTSFRKTFICLSLVFSIFAVSLCSAFAVPVYADNMFARMFSEIDDTIFVEFGTFGKMVSDMFSGTYNADECDKWLRDKYSPYLDEATGLYNLSDMPDGTRPCDVDMTNGSVTINQNFINEASNQAQEYCHRMDGYYLIEQNITDNDYFSYVSSSERAKISSDSFPPSLFGSNYFAFVYSSSCPVAIPKGNIGYCDNTLVNVISGTDFYTPTITNSSLVAGTLSISGYKATSVKPFKFSADYFENKITLYNSFVWGYHGSPFMLFYSSSFYQNYLNKGRQYYAPVINVPVTLPQNIINNGNISDLFHVEIGDRTGLSEEEIQKLLDDAVQKIIDGLQTTPTVAPTAPPSGGGGSTTVVDLSGTNNLLSKILEDLNTFADENFLGIEQLINEVQDFRESALTMLKDLNQKEAWDMVLLRLENLDKDFTAFVNDTSVKDSLDLILTRLANLDKDFSAFINDKTIPDLLNLIYAALTDMGGLNIDFTDLTQAVKDAGSGIENKINDLMVLLQAHWLLEGIGDIFDNLLQFISDRLSDVGHLIDTIVANVVGNLLSSLLDGLIGDYTDLTDHATDMATGIVSDAVKKFPVCIPWDLAALINAFGADPETPKFDIPITIASLNINETINIDLSNYEDLAVISRKFFMVLFLLTLTVQSRRLYGALMGVGGRE